MKKLLLTIVAVLILCVAVQAADVNEPDRAMTLWLSAANPSYQNTDLGVWLGYRQDNREIGLAMDWRMFSEGDTEPDAQSNFALGPYGVLHFPGAIDIDNPFADISWMPAKIAGDPFLSFEYLFDTDGKGMRFSPGVGIKLFKFVTLYDEYSWYFGNDADNQNRIGLSYEFNF
jgi:hypothetical protein